MLYSGLELGSWGLPEMLPLIEYNWKMGDFNLLNLPPTHSSTRNPKEIGKMRDGTTSLVPCLSYPFPFDSGN